MAKFQMPEAAKAKITKVRRIRTKLNSEEEESLLSKSSMKRDAEEVHRLAEALVEMKPTEYKKLDLDDDLRIHLDLARRIDAHIARKRQILFVAKQLRKRPDDLGGLFAAVDKPKSEQKRETARMHRLEQLRDELIADGDDALAKLLAQHPQADRQQLRTLVRQAATYKARQQQALDDGKPAPHNDGSYSALYKALNALMSQAEKPAADGADDSEIDDEN
jgi:ribosome-associated protein